jgi:hypothetical protein
MRTATLFATLALGCAGGELAQHPPPGAIQLLASDLIVGAPAEVVITGLFPNEPARLILSTRGAGAGPCHPSGAPCAGVRGPIVPMGNALADALGVATFQFVVPATVPAGTDVWFQGLTVLDEGASASVVSPVMLRTVQLGGTVDVDGDGYCANTTCTSGALPGDCDDADPDVNPGAVDACNGVDDDCDGAVDDQPDVPGCLPFYMDMDGDGFGAPGQERCLCAPAAPFDVDNDEDCFDANADAFPGQTTAFPFDRGDGSYDHDCDGLETPATGAGDCGCPVADTPFVRGWLGAPPACGVSAPFLASCTYQTVQVPNPLWPIVAPEFFGSCVTAAPDRVVTRTQACR